MTVATTDQLKNLIETYQRHRSNYRAGGISEFQLRMQFVDPLFIAMGWDVRNERGYAEAYKDVVHEDAVTVGTATKAPDYAFRVGGGRKFFLETKRPSIDITSEPEPTYQLRRYAWSAKLPLSILTNFEHLAVYDTRVKPNQNDPASTARVMLIHYTEYLDRWDEIAGIFGLESIRMGSFDEYAESARTKRGTAEVDDAFLADLEHWREMLARNIALRNGGLTQRELNYAVQITIDRIIFLRICEDRGIEEYGRLQQLQSGHNLYGRLQDLYRQADERYNSGLFHFRAESGRGGEPDELTTSLWIDDSVLKDIFKNLYYPHSPYEFSALPADILGQIYERFLGSVIRVGPSGKRAWVEEKPEVRKAGGVYYTPTYIVDDIVEHTVGKLLEGKTARQVARLKILDPACGSGSFLIGAYQYLLDWHQDWYVEDGPENHSKVLYQGQAGEWRLTTAERRRILLNNIYGVDIDQQAVEVTKLSLLLKVLEGETGESLTRQLQFSYKEQALPDLRKNIRCGNSLIGPDFYQNTQLGLVGFDEEERHRINVFDWKNEFKDIFDGNNPGFDAVIGNPPYIRIQQMREFAPNTLDYYKAHYRAA
ncbi:MAG: DNA methyltransferase, partial [Thermomicrobiaceae bacterium]